MAIDSTGTVYVADQNNYTIRKITAAGIVTTLAGTAGMLGSTDGMGAAAHFRFPAGVAVDGAGTVYVADQLNQTVRKVTAAGVVSTLAGAAGAIGSTDGMGAAAHFSAPYGVAVDSAGNVYVADTGNNTIRKITATGVVTTLAGTAGPAGSTDGTGPAARFYFPTGVAADSAGNVYVADSNNHTIRKITAAGVVTTLAGAAGAPGNADGMGSAVRFRFPTGVAVDSADNIYVADQANQTIRKITVTGMVTTLAGTAGSTGSTDGPGAAARFSSPQAVAVDSAGNVYVADAGNNAIRKSTASGVVTTLAGTAGTLGSVDGTGAAARFNGPAGVTVDSDGAVHVADKDNYTIRKISSIGIVTTLAGTAGMLGSVDGTGAAARFNSPAGVTVGSAGTVYVADTGNHTIRKLTVVGSVTTLAGAAGMAGSTDGTGAAARFNSPAGMAIDSAGTIYVADTGNHTVRKVTAAGSVTTLAGTAGMPGSSDGAGAMARFNRPSAVAVDSAGNVYVADTDNHTIRLVTTAGAVITLAGTAGTAGSVDSTGIATRFNRPTGVAIDSTGNIYVVDSNNATIRKVTAVGTTTTIAGMVGMKGIALGETPRFAFPAGLAITGDSITVSDSNAILVLRHGAR